MSNIHKIVYGKTIDGVYDKEQIFKDIKDVYVTVQFSKIICPCDTHIL